MHKCKYRNIEHTTEVYEFHMCTVLLLTACISIRLLSLNLINDI